MTEHLWAGPFGDDYSDRNAAGSVDRGPFWGATILRYPAHSALEVGCNIGLNLGPLMRLVPALAGVDVNERALTVARQSGIQADLRVASALRLPFVTSSFDLVFTAGLLIHLADDELPTAMDEIVRVSRRWVMAIEYSADENTVVPYRGQEAALWKRPYGDLYQGLHPELALRGGGFLEARHGFDDCTWWIFEKGTAAAAQAPSAAVLVTA